MLHETSRRDKAEGHTTRIASWVWRVENRELAELMMRGLARRRRSARCSAARLELGRRYDVVRNRHGHRPRAESAPDWR
jgi:hypothetical protein